LIQQVAEKDATPDKNPEEIITPSAGNTLLEEEQEETPSSTVPPSPSLSLSINYPYYFNLRRNLKN